MAQNGITRSEESVPTTDESSNRTLSRGVRPPDVQRSCSRESSLVRDESLQSVLNPLIKLEAKAPPSSSAAPVAQQREVTKRKLTPGLEPFDQPKMARQYPPGELFNLFSENEISVAIGLLEEAKRSNTENFMQQAPTMFLAQAKQMVFQIVKESRLPSSNTSTSPAALIEIRQQAHLPQINEKRRQLTMQGLDTATRLREMAEFNDGVTRYAEVTKVATIDCVADPGQTLISSVEHNSTGHKVVAADMSNKLKLFDFYCLLYNKGEMQHPLDCLASKHNVIDTCFSPKSENILATVGWPGILDVWDIGKKSVVRSFNEHGKRCWTVDFNNKYPKLMASGSDDATVKLWNIDCERSVAQIQAKANVCCVYFSPSDRDNLVFGSADHCVYHYDIRKLNRPVAVLKGHKKAVSYVRYINDNEVVSASTDSSLRVWNLREQKCTNILTGHSNTNFFVGLSGYRDHVICGSENSKAFIYYKDSSKPLCSYTIGNDINPAEEPAGFVSSVCWKKDMNFGLIANSLGKIHLVELM